MQLGFTNVWYLLLFIYFVVTPAGYKCEQLLYTLSMHCGRPVLVVLVISFVLHPAFRKWQQFLNALKKSALVLTNASISFVHWVCNCGVHVFVVILVQPCPSRMPAVLAYIEYAIA